MISLECVDKIILFHVEQLSLFKQYLKWIIIAIIYII